MLKAEQGHQTHPMIEGPKNPDLLQIRKLFNVSAIGGVENYLASLDWSNFIFKTLPLYPPYFIF